MAAVLSAELINASGCKRSRIISLWMYLSWAVEGKELICVWLLLNDELLGLAVKGTGHRSLLCLICRA